MKNKILFGIFTILIIVHIIVLVNAVIVKPLTSDPEYIKVLNEFQNKTWVPVIVGVINESVRDEVIASLAYNELSGTRISLIGDSFSGEITKEGLTKLSNNSNVLWINLKKGLTTGETSDNNNVDEIDGEDNNYKITEAQEISESKANYLSLWLKILVLVIITIVAITTTKKWNKRDETKKNNT